MRHLSLQLCALSALSALLLACASTPSLKKDPPSDAKSVSGATPKLGPAPKRDLQTPFDASAPTSSALAMVMGIPSLDGLGQIVADLAAASGWASRGELPAVETLLLQQIGGPFGLGWKNTDWVDLAAPVYAGFTKHSYMAFIPVKDLGAALAAMPAPCAPGATPCEAPIGEHLTAYVHRSRPVFVDLVGHHLVFSDHPKVFASIQTASKSIVRWAPSSGGDIYVLADGVRAHYKKQLDAMARELKDEMSGLFGTLADAGSWVQFLLDAFAETDWVRMSLARRSADGGALQISWGLRPKGGSGLAKALEPMAQAKLPWPEVMPVASYMGVLVDMKLTGWAAYDRLVAAQLKHDSAELRDNLGDKAAAEFLRATEALTLADTGKMWGALHADSRFPVGLSILAGMTGPAADLRAHYHRAFGVLLPRAWKETFGGAGEKGVPKPTLKGLMKWANKGLKPLGLKVSLQRGKSGGVMWDGFRLVPHKAKKAIKKKASLAELHSAMAGIGGKLELAMAFGNDRMSVTVGPTAIDRSRHLVGDATVPKQASPGRPPLLAKQLNAAMLAAMDFAGLFDALRNTPIIGQQVPPGPFKKGPAVVLSGQVVSGEARIVLTVPESYFSPLGDFLRFAATSSSEAVMVGNSAARP